MRGFYHSRIFPSVTAQPGDLESLVLQLLLLLFDGYRLRSTHPTRACRMTFIRHTVLDPVSR